jgi:hypothetical protein
MDSVVDRSPGDTVRTGIVRAAANVPEDGSAWVVDVASGRVVRRPINPRDPATGQSSSVN